MARVPSRFMQVSTNNLMKTFQPGAPDYHINAIIRKLLCMICMASDVYEFMLSQRHYPYNNLAATLSVLWPRVNGYYETNCVMCCGRTINQITLQSHRQGHSGYIHNLEYGYMMHCHLRCRFADHFCYVMQIQEVGLNAFLILHFNSLL